MVAVLGARSYPSNAVEAALTVLETDIGFKFLPGIAHRTQI
jgi:hypothetical protein